jgi:hypothetical protein
MVLSWALIFLLGMVMVVFVVSTILLVVWAIQGTPNITAGTSLVLQDSTLVEATALAKRAAIASMTGMRVLVSETGGYVVNTGAYVLPVDTENKFVQTLYIGGRPAVSRTTTFSQARDVKTEGPVQIRDNSVSQEIVQWYENAKADSLEQGNDLSIAKSAVGRLNIEKIMAQDLPKPLVSIVKPDPSSSSTSNVASLWSQKRRKQLEEALSTKATKRLLNDSKLRNPHQFQLELRQSNYPPCTKSSTLQLPLKLTVPTDYRETGRKVLWVAQKIVSVDDVQPLWQSQVVALSAIVGEKDSIEVDLGLDCATIAKLLIRLKLVDAANNTMIASIFFNPISLFTKGHAIPSTGLDTREAWHAFRSIYPT